MQLSHTKFSYAYVCTKEISVQENVHKFSIQQVMRLSYPVSFSSPRFQLYVHFNQRNPTNQFIRYFLSFPRFMYAQLSFIDPLSSTNIPMIIHYNGILTPEYNFFKTKSNENKIHLLLQVHDNFKYLTWIVFH